MVGRERARADMRNREPQTCHALVTLAQSPVLRSFPRISEKKRDCMPRERYLGKENRGLLERNGFSSLTDYYVCVTNSENRQAPLKVL